MRTHASSRNVGLCSKGFAMLGALGPRSPSLIGRQAHYGIWRAGSRSAAFALQAPGRRGALTSLVVAYRSYELFKKRFPQIESAVPDGESCYGHTVLRCRERRRRFLLGVGDNRIGTLICI